MSKKYITRTIKVKDFELNINESGTQHSNAIMFLHGSGPGVTAMSNWERTITQLSDQFYCIAPDMLGFADSSHPNPPPLGGDFMQLRIDTLFDLMDAMELKHVTLVGNSMGGAIALRMAYQKPERIKRLVLMGTALGKPKLTPGLKLVSTYYEEPTVERLTQLLKNFVYDPSLFGDDLGKIAATRVPCANREDVRRSHIASFAPNSPLPPEVDPKEITQPCLVMHGRDDRILEMSEGLDLLAKLPNVRAHFFGQCGHWTQIEHPDEFEQQVRMFCTE